MQEAQTFFAPSARRKDQWCAVSLLVLQFVTVIPLVLQFVTAIPLELQLVTAIPLVLLFVTAIPLALQFVTAIPLALQFVTAISVRPVGVFNFPFAFFYRELHEKKICNLNPVICRWRQEINFGTRGIRIMQMCYNVHWLQLL
jgi:hypothetical protein